MKKEEHLSEKNPYNISYENYLDTTACTEVTGLIPRAAHDREEWDAYREIFDFTAKPPRPEDDHKKPDIP